jgi:hypothetical protein
MRSVALTPKRKYEREEKRMPGSDSIDIPELLALLNERDGAARVIPELRSRACAERQEGNLWDLAGQHFCNNGRYYEGLTVHYAFYDQLLALESRDSKRLHKGTPLIRISDAHRALNHPALAKRYLMLTTCEDAIRGEGVIPADTTGTYFRSVWHFGLSHDEFARYASEVWQIATDHRDESRFPEWILQELDQYWMTEYPSPEEATTHAANTSYVKWLLSKLGSGDGLALERLAHYLLTCIPGIKAYKHTRSKSTDYDVVCAPEGVPLDFRSELGRYFLCECKDWEKPADVTAVVKFASVLRSAQCRFGMIFSKKGISGEGETEYAERELLKIFQHDNLTILVISEGDLERVSHGASFLALLRTKYEQVRLDLPKTALGAS